MISWSGSGLRPCAASPSRGGLWKTSRSSVCVTGRHFPVRMKNGTPDQRQFSISSRMRRVGLGLRVGRHAVDLAVADVLAAYVVRRVGVRHRAVHVAQCVLEDRRPAAGGRLHRGRADHLHQVVDHHVAQGADRVVEVAAVVDAEVLGHRDLDRGDVVAVPDRLERRVREPQVEDLRQAHLPQEVVDPVQLRLVDVLVDLLVELARRREVVPERLLDDDAGVLGQARPRRGPPRRCRTGTAGSRGRRPAAGPAPIAAASRLNVSASAKSPRR